MLTYIISLDNVNVCKLKELGLNPVLVRGIDGKNCDKSIIREQVYPLYAAFAPKAAIGCALSHLKVWKLLLESGEESCIVLEDDVVFVSNFSEKLSTLLEKVPKDFDILYLGCFGSENTPNFFTTIMSILGKSREYRKVNDVVFVPEVSLATHAYIVSRKGAEKLLDNLYGKVFNHIDYCIQSLSDIRVYCARERLAYQTSTDEGKSMNVSSSFPKLVNEILSKIYIDTKVRASYISTLSIARIPGDLNVNIVSVIFLIVGIIAAYNGLYAIEMLIYVILFSIPDILECKDENDKRIIFLHWFLILLPFYFFLV